MLVAANRKGSREHRHSSRKIDLATAAVIAYDRATTRRDRKVSIYETRDLIILGEDLDEDDDEEDDW
jgi:hypothetical protein